MTNDEIKKLCQSLICADSEQEVINILEDAGYWNNDLVWRSFDDNDNNWSSMGNQMSSPDAALIEKITNSVDARLINECLVLGKDPESDLAPPSIKEAVKMFFGGTGRLKDWTIRERAEIAKGITLTATGFRASEGNPCFSIADCGEGQTPLAMPFTFLSLSKRNKQGIHFVQGKFNMGGTGVLKFCGHHNLQLILSRRNPTIVSLAPKDKTDYDWGFTIVRRFDPDRKRRNSMFVYLAPNSADLRPYRGDILHFSSISMPIFPEDNKPYVRESEWGTLIKLYEYTGYKSHILMKDGLLRRVDLLLPEVALPIKLHECRIGFKGADERSFSNTLNGLTVRLEDDKANNLEFEPSTFSSVVGLEPIGGIIYAFKKEKADTYRKNEGIIFTNNGQTHGHLKPDFFKRKKVGMSYLADSLLVIVDCSDISGRAREDLFMNSRDRLSDVELRYKIEEELEIILKNHPALTALKERRRREEIESIIGDSKPLEKVLESVLQKSPTLSALFLRGKRISNPFKTESVQQKQGPFKGKKYPTYFKFMGKDYGKELDRECNINMRFRITFETDAENDYFKRDTDQGEFSLYLIKDDKQVQIDRSITLHDGIASLTVKLPDNCYVGDVLEYISITNDSTQISPFQNKFKIKINKAIDVSQGSSSRRKPPGQKPGSEREIPSGIAFPQIKVLHESDWNTVSPPFDKYSALRVKDSGEGDNGQTAYDFFVNLDNIYYKNELKGSKKDLKLLEARFTNALVLIGLALLQDKTADSDELNEDMNESGGENIEDKIENISKLIAPILLPMIDVLGDIEESA